MKSILNNLKYLRIAHTVKNFVTFGTEEYISPELKIN